MIVIAGACVAVAQQGGSDKGPKVPEQLRRKAADRVVRVIVDLNVSVEPEEKLTTEGRERQRQRIAEAQDRLLADLAGTSYKAPRRLVKLPGLVLSVGADALAVLEKSTLVKKVTEDISVKSDLKIREER
jgi:hypothetical protein